MRPGGGGGTIYKSWGFNPRTRKGCDWANWKYYVRYSVSIHAPVKDATTCLWKALLITFSAYNFANNKVYK